MRSLLIFVMATSVFFACKKEKQETTNPEENQPPVFVEDSADYSVKSEYLPMKVGNYWVYDVYEMDMLGNERLLDYKDSVIVIQDTTFSHGRYYSYDNILLYDNGSTRKGLFDGFISDSSKNKLNNHFYENRFNEEIHSLYNINNDGDTLSYINFYIIEPSEMISVPAGNFNTLIHRGIVHDTTGRCRNNPNRPKNIDKHYAKAIGIVKHKYFYMPSCSTYFERRLVRYHIEE